MFFFLIFQLNPTMEEFIARFPVIGQEIFNQLDNQTLTKCKEVSRDLNQFLEDDRLVWTRIIKKYDASHVEFKDAWKLVVNLQGTCWKIKGSGHSLWQFLFFFVTYGCISAFTTSYCSLCWPSLSIKIYRPKNRVTKSCKQRCRMDRITLCCLSRFFLILCNLKFGNWTCKQIFELIAELREFHW